MANLVIILGPSGSGKSRSVKGLDPSETVVLNTLRKRLPFEGSTKLYNKENKNIFEINGYSEVISMLNNISEKGTHIHNVVLDDSIYVMRKEYFDRSKEKGYDKYTDLAVHFQSIIETCEQLRSDLNVFLILHSEPVMTDGAIVGYKVATVGSLLDKQYNPIEIVPVILFSAVKFNEGKPQYGFFTNATIEKGAIIPAKSPEGMFNDLFIDNDLGVVVQRMNDYY